MKKVWTTTQAFTVKAAIFKISIIKELLLSSDPHRSQGCDLAYLFVMREVAAKFEKPLRMLFKHSLSTEEVPRAWLQANVIPIYKKGAHMDPSNYRPISLTSIICKLLEKIIKRN